MNCGTGVIGTIDFKCSKCNTSHVILRRCNHRFCARCGYMDTQRWAQNTLSRLENIKHHHIVFTLPKALRNLARQNQTAVYNLMFEAAHQTIIHWFEHKHNIKPGIVSVLHTFGSDLKYHPHLHLIVTAGGKDVSNNILELKSHFLTSQRFIANLYRNFFIKRLLHQIDDVKLNLDPALEFNPRRFKSWISQLQKCQWIVNIQKPLKDILQIVGYVGRYTKRACISEYKIIDIKNKRIKFYAFDYKNSPRNQKPKKVIIDLHFVEFLDRLLQHVPNHRFRMVRYAGIYNSHYLKKKKTKTKIHSDIDFDDIIADQFLQYRNLQKEKEISDPLICPNCKSIMIFDQITFNNTYNVIDDP